MYNDGFLWVFFLVVQYFQGNVFIRMSFKTHNILYKTSKGMKTMFYNVDALNDNSFPTTVHFYIIYMRPPILAH